jgi:protoporphyrinogen oxidase
VAVERVRYVVVGAGVSGLAFARFVGSEACLVLEREQEIGGYCRTVKQDGFVWDYSGHFFHFRHPEIERLLTEGIDPGEIETVRKVAKIYIGKTWVDFPFQKNIHQLPREEFLTCLHDLFFRAGGVPKNFYEMLYAKFGRGIAEMFLIPYNEKLYACDLKTLDVEAMGRFFPHASLEEIVANFVKPDHASYNATFTYPKGGAIEYVRALARGVREDRVSLGEGVVSVDLERKVVHTTRGREVGFEYLISSAPLPRLLEMAGLEAPPGTFTSNKVVVFNLGFDRKGPTEPHWVYYPDPALSFYRVGFYDNIFGSERMSLYVEVGRRTEEEDDLDALLGRVLADLEAVGVVQGHRLVSKHQVTLDPAYVHITKASQEACAGWRQKLQARGVYSVGRYGGWTYCSIEDNVVESRALAAMFRELHGGGAG